MTFRLKTFLTALFLTFGLLSLFARLIPVLTPPEAKVKTIRLNLKQELLAKKIAARRIVKITPKIERNFNPNSSYQALNNIKTEKKNFNAKKKQPKTILSGNPKIISRNNPGSRFSYYRESPEGENLPGESPGFTDNGELGSGNLTAGKGPEGGQNSPPAAEKAELTTRPDREILAEFQSMVSRKLDAAKLYPEEAREQKNEGTVALTFLVKPDGSPSGAQISGSSGFAQLDQAALQTINAAAPFLPFPAGKAGFPGGIKVKARLVFKLSR